MSDPRFVDEDQTVLLHPLAERLDTGGLNQAGRCICGEVLPAQAKWHMAGCDWQHIRCPKCRWLYVDEGEYIAIYEDHVDPCCHIEENQQHMERERHEAELNASRAAHSGRSEGPDE